MEGRKKELDKGFKNAPNPFVGKKKPTQTKKFVKPDPSKKVNCREDRPIRMNPTGKYNLNFIDWDNEFDRIMSADVDDLPPGQSPIYGMNMDTFMKI